MAFDFNNYEVFAKKLQNGPAEEDFRNSISRGYYCIYHKVKTFFGHNDKTFIRHEDLIRGFRDSKLKKKDKLSMGMQNLKQNREQADYYCSPKIDNKEIIFDKGYIDRFWIRYDNFIKLLGEEKLED